MLTAGSAMHKLMLSRFQFNSTPPIHHTVFHNAQQILTASLFFAPPLFDTTLPQPSTMAAKQNCVSTITLPHNKYNTTPLDGLSHCSNALNCLWPNPVVQARLGV